MVTLSRELRYLYPDEEDWWVSDAFATRRSESNEDAEKFSLMAWRFIMIVQLFDIT